MRRFCELFAFYRCYILSVRILRRFDAAGLMSRVVPHLAHDQTVNRDLHYTTKQKLQRLAFLGKSITLRIIRLKLFLRTNQVALLSCGLFKMLLFKY